MLQVEALECAAARLERGHDRRVAVQCVALLQYAGRLADAIPATRRRPYRELWISLPIRCDSQVPTLLRLHLKSTYLWMT